MKTVLQLPLQISVVAVIEYAALITLFTITGKSAFTVP